LTVGDATWSQFTGFAISCSSATLICRDIAAVANALDHCKDEVGDALAHVAKGAIRPDNRVVKEVGDLVVDRASKKVVDAVATAVHIPVVIQSLRLFGVSLCMAAGCNLGRCKCLQDLLTIELKDMAKEKVEDKVKEILEGGLDQLLYPTAA
jgi:hypothetical protein